MSYNLTQQELNEMRDWSAKAEQLVRLGMLPVGQLPYIKRALKAVQSDAFLPLLLRKPFYKFIEELMELSLGEPGIYRLIRNKVAANRNDSVINRYMPEGTTMDEEVLNEEAKTSFKKLLRPNFYKDDEATANRTETAKIAAKAHAKAKITEDRDADEKAGDHEDRKFKAAVKARDAKTKWKTTTTSDGRKVKVEDLGEALFDKNHLKAMAAKSTRLGAPTSAKDFKVGKPKAAFTVTPKSPTEFKVKKNTNEELVTELKADTYLSAGRKAVSRLQSLAVKRGIDQLSSTQSKKGTVPITPSESRHSKGVHNAMSLLARKAKANEEQEVLNMNILDEDVNYRKTPQGMLQTLSNMVKIKKRHGGKVSVNDRKIASKARNELRRRKYFGSGSSITASFDTAYLDLADYLAEEGIFLNEEQLDELKITTMMRAYSDRMDKSRHHGSLAASRARNLLHPNEDSKVRINRVLERKNAKKADKTLWHMANKGRKVQEEAEVLDEISDELKTRYAEKVQSDFKEKGVRAKGRKQFDKVMKRLKTADKILQKEEVEPLEEISRELRGKYVGAAIKDREVRRAEYDKVVAREKNPKTRTGLSADELSNSRKYFNRHKGIDRSRLAFAKMGPKKVVESVEVLDELSRKTLGSYVNKAVPQKSDADFNAGVLAHKPNQNQDYPIFSDSKKNGGLGSSGSANKMLRVSEKRGKGILNAVKKMSESYADDTPPSNDEWESSVEKPKKKVRPSKSTWYKSVDDAADVKGVDPKMRVRFNKEEFEKRVATTLDLFEVKNISELDDESAKLFLSLVQMEAKSDLDYHEKVYSKIQASKKGDSNLTPEQIRYRAEKQARADKAKSAMDSARAEMGKAKIGTGWSKLPSDK